MWRSRSLSHLLSELLKATKIRTRKWAALRRTTSKLQRPCLRLKIPRKIPRNSRLHPRSSLRKKILLKLQRKILPRRRTSQWFLRMIFSQYRPQLQREKKPRRELPRLRKSRIRCRKKQKRRGHRSKTHSSTSALPITTRMQGRKSDYRISTRIVSASTSQTRQIRALKFDQCNRNWRTSRWARVKTWRRQT